MVQAINILERLSQRRRDLGMTYHDLSRRSGISVSTVKRVLGGEEAASFSSVAAIAEVLGMHMASAPEEDIASMRERQAEAKARSLVALVQGTSALEAQAVGPAHLRLMKQRTVAELLSGSARRLWAQ